jgi:3'-phosphoadenosine 5'-phosphosulfate sulfotransferase (PAPS reductase)/FAD synthetase
VKFYKTGETPLIVNFSGGKDSMVLLDLVRQTTDKYVCFYMVSGIEFAEAIDFVKVQLLATIKATSSQG